MSLYASVCKENKCNLLFIVQFLYLEFRKGIQIQGKASEFNVKNNGIIDFSESDRNRLGTGSFIIKDIVYDIEIKKKLEYSLW